MKCTVSSTSDSDTLVGLSVDGLLFSETDSAEYILEFDDTLDYVISSITDYFTFTGNFPDASEADITVSFVSGEATYECPVDSSSSGEFSCKSSLSPGSYSVSAEIKDIGFLTYSGPYEITGTVTSATASDSSFAGG